MVIWWENPRAPFSAFLRAYPDFLLVLAFNNPCNLVLSTVSSLIPFNVKPVLPSAGRRETAESLLLFLSEVFPVFNKVMHVGCRKSEKCESMETRLKIVGNVKVVEITTQRHISFCHVVLHSWDCVNMCVCVLCKHHCSMNISLCHWQCFLNNIFNGWVSCTTVHGLYILFYDTVLVYSLYILFYNTVWQLWK